jgi:uncharacterized protein YegJ (DUF2314 family)
VHGPALFIDHWSKAKEWTMKQLLLLLLTCLCVGACNAQVKKSDTLIDTGYDEEEMEAAIARARTEVDSFIAELRRPTGESHAVKVPITDQGDTEHFWLIDVSYSDGEFAGTINNDPGMVSNVRIGDKRKVKKSEISDWMFMRDGKMYGNYTLRPLLEAMPTDEAERYRSILAEP